MVWQDFVVLLLKKVWRFRSGDGNMVNPFDPAHARVPGDDHSQWETVVGGKGFSIHLHAASIRHRYNNVTVV